MHEGGRRNPRVIVAWARDATFDIRQEIGSRAVRPRQPQEEATEETLGNTDIEENDVAATAGSEDVDR
jgi:hypothetical protein